MIKRKIDNYLTEYYANNSNALLLTGARQIGKTYSIRNFGKQFKSFIEINFIENPSAIDAFNSVNNTQDFLMRLSLITKLPLIKGETLIFFDEVQKCPNIVTQIKFLVEEGSFRYILSGSMLGVELNDLRSVPVGYMGIKDMYPIDFEEFISCLGVNTNIINSLKESWINRTPVDPFIHQKMIELFRLYLVIGGMPAVVKEYLQSNNLQNVLKKQKEILRLYHKDISQYDPKNKLYIEDIFKLIPSELNSKNKRFILKKLNENAKFERYINSFLWLSNAGVALPTYNVEEPKIPLIISKSRNLFKLFQSDVGLLAAQYADGIQLKIIQGDKDINFGAIYENVIAQELTAHNFDLYYYNNKKRGEIDFVVEYNGNVLALEIKSGKDYQIHRALSNIMDCDDYNLQRAIVFNNDNLRVCEKIIYAPIYMVMFLEKQDTAPSYYKIDLNLMR